jgi:hypothetical protein
MVWESEGEDEDASRKVVFCHQIGSANQMPSQSNTRISSLKSLFPSYIMSNVIEYDNTFIKFWIEGGL